MSPFVSRATHRIQRLVGAVGKPIIQRRFFLLKSSSKAKTAL